MKLHNTLTRQKDALELSEQPIKIYTCGLTVYSQPHIGNWVGYIYWDVLVRLLRYQGIEVVRTQNITDVGHLTSDDDDGEDKMEKGARREGKTAWDVAEKYMQIAEYEAYDILKLTRPDHLARATDYIQQQIDFARQLEEKGFTYIIEGDGLYFDTSKLADYGKLARLDIDGLEAGARVSVEGKRNITDFAVWKFSPTDRQRDMEWDSPWGRGFPGWHLECSVIARETLGDTIDIHTGGIDHIPVHHTNEIAQTESLTGKPFAKIWLHNNHLKVNGTKISKSLGNGYTLTNLIQQGYTAMDYKIFVLQSHYSHEGNFSWANLKAAHNRLQKWYHVACLRHQIHDRLEDDDVKNDGQPGYVSTLAASGAIREALCDNLNTPTALQLIDQTFDTIANRPLRSIHQHGLVIMLKTIDQLLGLDLCERTPDIDDSIKRLILARQRAREAQDWSAADKLRNELSAKHIAIRDTPDGPVWWWEQS